MTMDFIARGLAQGTRHDLASPDAGKGASLIGLEAGGTLAQNVANRVTPQQFGCDPGDPSTSDKLNDAFQYAAANDAWLDLGGYTYLVDRTIRPGGTVRILSGEAGLLFLASGTYDDIFDMDGNATGLKVAFDIDATWRTAILGNLSIYTDTSPYAANLVALTIGDHADARANGRLSNEWKVSGQLYIGNFDGPFYQPPESASGMQSLPYTRNHYLSLDMRFCRAWDMLGKNGWDDTYAGFLRINKFRATSNMKRVDLCAGSLFIVGEKDHQPWTFTCTASGNAVTASSGHGVSVGERFAFIGAGPDGSNISAEVTDVSGDTLTLDGDVSTAVTNGATIACGEGITGDFLNVTAGNAYFEGAFYTPPLYLTRSPSIDLRNVKISSGDFSTLSGGPILCEATSGRIEVAMSNDIGQNKTIAYLAKRSGSAVAVTANMEASLASYGGLAPPLDPVVFGPSLIKATSGDAAAVDSTATVRFADQTAIHLGKSAGNESHAVVPSQSGLTFDASVKAPRFLTNDSVTTIDDGQAEATIAAADLPSNSTHIVIVRPDTGSNGRGMALVTKASSNLAIDTISANGIAFGKDGSNNLTVTNNTGANGIFRTTVLTTAIREAFA